MTEQLPGTFYDYPRYYDLVYGSDWKAERDFLVAVFEQHASRRVKRLLEPACGSGRLLLPLARAGFLVSGLDLNPAMVEYCNRRLDRHGFGQPAWVGDMSDFELTTPVDAAFNTINSFRHLEDHQQAVGHLESMQSTNNKLSLRLFYRSDEMPLTKHIYCLVSFARRVFDTYIA